MSSWLETYKPIGSSRLQLWLAGAMWSTVGTVLFLVGAYWLLAEADTKSLLLLVVAACLGVAKRSLVLDRTVNKVIRRIQLRGEDRCVGGFLAPRVWVMVTGMIFLGRLLRSIAVSRPVLGLVYAAVGIALLISSRSIWRAWLRQPHHRQNGKER